MLEKIKLNAVKILLITLLIMIGFSYYNCDRINKLKTENTRVSNNFTNSQFELDSVKLKNGQLAYYSQGLTLKTNELANVYTDLAKSIESMGLKIKNLEGVSNVNYSYNYFTDTTKITKLSDTTYKSELTDNWLKLSQRISLINNRSSILVDSLNLSLTDSLLIPFEIQYKRSWIFWKKPIGVKVYVKSNNPHFKVNQLKYIKLIK